MIKLTRKDLRPVLQEQVEARVTRLRAYLTNGEDPPEALLNAYRDPEVKKHLIAETSGKCIYCESKITHVYFGDIEHIKPKSEFPMERLSIENLGFACALCNNAKGNFWDAATPLIDPYVDDPTTEFLAFGVLITRRPGRDRARLSITQLDLNRQALIERRKERIELLQALADQYTLASEGAIKDLIRTELTRQAGDDSEYALVVRAYLETACGLRLNASAGSNSNAVTAAVAV